MDIQHPVFCRRVKNNKVIIMAIIDEASLNLNDSKTDCFYVATTTNDSSTKNPIITLNSNSRLSAKDYVKIVNEHSNTNLEDTEGKSIEDITKAPYWFIRHIKAVMAKIFNLTLI